MDDFLKKYVIKFSHKSISTTDFQNYFCEFFTDKVQKFSLMYFLDMFRVLYNLNTNSKYTFLIFAQVEFEIYYTSIVYLYLYNAGVTVYFLSSIS